MQPYTALPAPISALRCTEAESRMEQSRVRWQWHPSHAMNNQWTPSGAYNRGAQLQSFSPGCLSQFTPLTVSQFFTCSLAFLSPLFPHIFTQSLFHCLFNLHPRPVLHPSPALTPHLHPSFEFSSRNPIQLITWPVALQRTFAFMIYSNWIAY